MRPVGLLGVLLLLCIATQLGSAAIPSTVAVPDESAWLDGQVSALLPTAADRRWEGGGWTLDVDEGLARARALRRPLFVLCVTGEVHSGHT